MLKIENRFPNSLILYATSTVECLEINKTLIDQRIL